MIRPTFSLRDVSARAVVATVAVAALAWPTLSGAASLELPKGVDAAAAKQMYAEQVESQSSIRGLVDGRITSFTVTKRVVRADSAELQLRVVDRSGAARRGLMKLVKADGTWYFSSIDPVGLEPHEPAKLTGRYDVGVLNTILSEQKANADTTAKLVDGTYTQVVIGKRKPGYRSVVLPVSFKGRSGKSAAGEVTAVMRREAGSDRWFLASFDTK